MGVVPGKHVSPQPSEGVGGGFAWAIEVLATGRLKGVGEFPWIYVGQGRTPDQQGGAVCPGRVREIHSLSLFF